MRAKVAILPWGDTIESFLDTIGISLESFATEMSGGWLFGYAAALASADIATCIVCVSRRETRPRRFVNPETDVVTMVIPAAAHYWWAAQIADRTGLPARAATPPLALAEVFRNEGCTHLLNQEYEYHRFQVAASVARDLGMGVYATFQGGTPAVTVLARRQRRRTLRAADGLVVAARAEAERVKAAYGVEPARIAMIPNPIDLALWHPAPRGPAREALDLPEDAVVAICHCRIEIRRKGLDVLLEAWRRVAAARPGRDLRLHLVGSGSDDARLAEAVARDPVPGLFWTRVYSQDRAEMRRRLSAADLHVLASRHEGFPVAPLEAMACGLPTVLTDIPGSADILAGGEGGLVVPAEDTDSLAEALGQLVDDPGLRARLGAQARARIEREASIPSVGARLAAFLLGERV